MYLVNNGRGEWKTENDVNEWFTYSFHIRRKLGSIFLLIVWFVDAVYARTKVLYVCNFTDMSAKEYMIEAAPGLPPIPETDSFAKNRSDVLEYRYNHYQWYWKSPIEAIKPLDDYVPER